MAIDYWQLEEDTLVGDEYIQVGDLNGGKRRTSPNALKDFIGDDSSNDIIPKTITEDYSMVAADQMYKIDASSNTVEITLLPASENAQHLLYIKAIDATNAITITPNGAELIDRSNSSIELILMESLTLYSDGTEWWIL